MRWSDAPVVDVVGDYLAARDFTLASQAYFVRYRRRVRDDAGLRELVRGVDWLVACALTARGAPDRVLADPVPEYLDRNAYLSLEHLARMQTWAGECDRLFRAMSNPAWWSAPQYAWFGPAWDQRYR